MATEDKDIKARGGSKRPAVGFSGGVGVTRGYCLQTIGLRKRRPHNEAQQRRDFQDALARCDAPIPENWKRKMGLA